MNNKFKIGILFALLLVLIAGYQGVRYSILSAKVSISHNDKKAIENYLNKELSKPSFGGKNFSAFEVLGKDKVSGDIYIWAIIQEYYKENNNIEQGTGILVPLVLEVTQKEGSLKIINHKYPRDGSYYVDDIKNIFPISISYKVLNYPQNHTDKLINEIENKLKNNFLN